jgi:hypothetical protein
MFISLISDSRRLLYADDSISYVFPYKFRNLSLKISVKNWNHAVSALSITFFLYTLRKLNALYFDQSEKLKTIADFQINCNGHLLKSQSCIK